MNRISYGERAQIGLIYPHTGWVMEPEFFAMAPEGVNIITTRIRLGAVTAENAMKLSGQVEDAAVLLDEGCSDVIVLGCTSGSFICGPDYDQEIIRKIKAVSRPETKASTTATAVIHAIDAMQCTRIAVGTPYIDEINQQAIRFLSAHGKTVVQFKGLGLLKDSEINRLSREEIRQLIRDIDTPSAQMLVLLCTSIKGVDILEEMEHEIGKPIITAIQATFWECLNLVGIRREVRGFGSLFWN